MWQTVLNTVLVAAVAALAAVLGKAITAFGDAGISLLTEKAAAIKAKAGKDKWDFWTGMAHQAWNITEENTRIIPTAEKTIAAKQAEFGMQLKFPTGLFFCELNFVSHGSKKRVILMSFNAIL